MIQDKKITDLFYWVAMLSLLFWFAYTKGWILTNFESVDAKTAITLLENDDNISILDVRTIPEYKAGHLRGATLIPLQVLSDNLVMLKEDKNRKIIVYCATGNRSISASRILEKNGFTPINVKGGIMDLAKEGVEVVK
jgi:rhodanese-related sulfurtransferase